jgi:hypothetical protein
MNGDIEIDKPLNAYETQLDNSKLKDDEQLRSFKTEFFKLIKIMIVVMFGIAYTFMLSTIANNPNTGATVIVVTSLMVPTVITLALVRFLYAKNTPSEEKTPPSVGFNFLKELLKVLKDYLAKK